MATIIRPCPQCGVEGEADASEVVLVCPHCGHAFNATRVGVWADGVPAAPGYSDQYVFELALESGVYYVVAGLEIGSGDAEWWEEFPSPRGPFTPHEIDPAHVRRHCLLPPRVRA